ncbi:MAG TPA: hypothetical protein VID70_03065, partial [Solirubrobacteraceae bacterium]
MLQEPTEKPVNLTDDLRRLGEELHARTDEVVAGLSSRSKESGQVLDALVEDSFAKVGSVS